ncbi:MAG TPA: hypothetical protein PLA50_08685 [Bacteroidia bacterium]|nr:hypothetical protein [Bacteroidia bacterium]
MKTVIGKAIVDLMVFSFLGALFLLLIRPGIDDAFSEISALIGVCVFIVGMTSVRAMQRSRN